MRLILAIAMLLLSAPAWAHKPSDSLLSLTVQHDRIEGRWDIALRDLDDAIGLDADGDGALTWGEVRSKHDEVAAYALSRLTITSSQTRCSTAIRRPCRMTMRAARCNSASKRCWPNTAISIMKPRPLRSPENNRATT